MRKFFRSHLPKYRAKPDTVPGVNPIRNHRSSKSSKSWELTW